MKRSLTAICLAVAASSISGVASAADVKTQDPGKPFGDWRLRCREIAPGDTSCLLSQKIVSSETKLPVAAFVLARNKDSHALRLTAILPLGLDIPAGVSGKAGAVPLSLTVQTCVKRGCVANVSVDDKLLESLRGVETFTTTFRMRGVQEPTTLPVSLKGLDEGLKALEGK